MFVLVGRLTSNFKVFRDVPWRTYRASDVVVQSDRQQCPASTVGLAGLKGGPFKPEGGLIYPVPMRAGDAEEDFAKRLRRGQRLAHAVLRVVSHLQGVRLLPIVPDTIHRDFMAAFCSDHDFHRQDSKVTKPHVFWWRLFLLDFSTAILIYRHKYWEWFSIRCKNSDRERTIVLSQKRRREAKAKNAHA